MATSHCVQVGGLKRMASLGYHATTQRTNSRVGAPHRLAEISLGGPDYARLSRSGAAAQLMLTLVVKRLLV